MEEAMARATGEPWNRKSESFFVFDALADVAKVVAHSMSKAQLHPQPRGAEEKQREHERGNKRKN